LTNGPSYKFESGSIKPPLEDKNLQKIKIKSTGGAGFSSQGSTSTATVNEPTSAQRRTPRRTLGVLVNENNGV
jgi:hypothetical protein